MKIPCLIVLLGIAAASPAFALKVTNLDKVPHGILFEAAGTKEALTLEPGEVHYFASTPAGRISLVDAHKPSKGTAVQTQGILRNYIGNGRNQEVPADPDDQFAIWPGGELVLQKHIRQQGVH